MRDFKAALDIDPNAERGRIGAFLRASLGSLRRDGAVVGLSGGIDSAVTVALCVEALGQGKVVGLILPERESDPASAELAQRHADKLGIRCERLDITPVLEALGAYMKRDEAVRSLYPEFRTDDKIKISLPPDLLGRDALNVYTLSIYRGSDLVFKSRLRKADLNAIVAATNTKQRTRMLYLYHRAEKNNYLVCGTTNRTELIQGFFVKYGDGGVDIEPIAHLFKTQVYELAAALAVPEEIIRRLPSADTFSQTVSDEEFYFRLPYDRLDPLLWAWERKIAPAETAAGLGLGEDQVKRAFRDFDSKSRAARHLLMMPPSLDVRLVDEALA